MPQAFVTTHGPAANTDATVRACVVIPTFDHGGTVADVVARAAKILPVIVVDDGSRDDTAARLTGAAATVLRHEHNRGKGAALRTALAAAHAAGFTHAIALDADGQHAPEQLPLLLQAATAQPDALVLGARDLRAAGAGPGSRFGGAFSNFWTWVETGHRLHDTQTGYRCYPLALVDSLAFATSGYDFEIEVLVKASWCGAPLVSVPITVHYPPRKERVSHLRPVVDFLRIGWLNTRLVTMRLCLPIPYLAVRSRRAFWGLPYGQRLRASLRECFLNEAETPARVAAAVALGVFLGLAPIWGFQMLLTLVLAHRFRLSKAIALTAANISFPVVVPLILYVSLVFGRVLLGSAPPAGSIGSLQLTGADFGAWILGSFALATVASITLGTIALLLARGVQRMRRGGGAP